MKTLYLLVSSILLFLCTTTWGQITLVNYSFNTGTSYSTLNGNPFTGLSTSLNSDAVFTTSAGVATGSQAFTPNTTAGNALVFNNISGSSTLKLDVLLSGAPLSNFINYALYFQARRTTTGAAFINLYYSLDSSSFNFIQTIDLTLLPASQFNEYMIDLSGVTAINNTSKLIYRLEFGGATSVSGTCRLDNLQIRAACSPSSEPTVSPDSLTVSQVGCQQLSLSWKKGDGLKTLIIVSANNPVSVTPTDLISYNASSVYGSGYSFGGGQYVVYNDTGNVLTVTGLSQNTTYYFKAFSFNGDAFCPASANYLTSGTIQEVSATTGKCFEILSILVHACGAPESYNEMFRFKTGNEPINIFDLQVGGSSSNNLPVWGKWPNNSLPFNGFYQSNYTHLKVDSINQTIANSCGILIEPPGGIVPPNSQVIVFTDTMVSPTANSFAALSDTLYAIFQKFTSDPSQGCFRNTTNGSLSSTPNGTSAVRNLGLRSISNNNLFDIVSYDAMLLVNTNYGTSNPLIYGGTTTINRGATVYYDDIGNATYVNNGCKAPIVTFSVVPEIKTVKGNNILCTGDSILLKAHPTGVYTNLQWSGGNGGTFITPVPGVDSIWYVATNADVGTISFHLHVEGYCGEVIDSTLTLTVVRPSEALITPAGPTTFCSGNQLVLQGNSGNGYTYTWLPGNQNTPSITVSSSGQYILIVNNVCGTSSDTVNVVVNPLPAISINANGPLTFCEGNSVGITATLINGSGYSWSFGGNASTVTIDSSMTVYAIAYDLVNGCPNDTSVILQVTEVPYPQIEAGANTSICSGDVVSLGNPASSGLTYTWSSNVGGFSSNNAQITVSPSTTTTYYYQASNGTCVSYDTVTVTVSSLVPLSVTITSNKGNSICAGDLVTLTANVSGGGTNPSYQWFVNGVALTNQTGQTFTISTLNTNDQVWCVVTSSLTCSTGSPDTSNKIVFTVTNAPNVSITPSGPTTFCTGQSVVLTATGLQTGDTFSWSTGQVTTSISVSTSQTISLTASNSCGQDVENIVVTVNSLPTVQINTSGPTTICQGNSVTLNYTAMPGVTYSWSNGQPSGTIVVNSSGWVVLTGYNSCGTVKDSVQIVVNPLPTANITASGTVICNNDSVLLTSSSTTNNLWSTGQTTQAIWVKNGGTYSLTVGSAGCGNAVANVIINAETVIASFTSSADSGYVPLTINFTSTGTGAVAYSWDFGNITNTTGPTVSATYDAPGVFNVILTAVGQLGCKDTASKKIVVTDPPVTLEFPNIFSPNNDSKNDVFAPIKKVGIIEATLEIYNRWGLKIFETTNLNLEWDGRTISGQELPEGVYYYIARVKTKSGTNPEMELKGYITLVK